MLKKTALLGRGIDNVTALSLALGWTTEASLPHLFTNAFKDVLAVSLGTSYTFDALNGKELVEAIKSGKALGGSGGGGPAPVATAAAAAPVAAKPAPAPEPEEEAEDFGGLFD